MQDLRSDSAICRYISKRLNNERFTLIDIGCSGGIAPGWRSFGNRWRAVGFDPNIHEIDRLIRQESSSGVSYVTGFVGLPPPEHPIAQRRGSGPYWRRNPCERFSVARTRSRTAASLLATGDQRELTKHNLWKRTQLADADKPILLTEYLVQNGIHDVDFLKIAIDGPDFDVLRGFEDGLARNSMLGVGMEVNFFGSEDEDEHTFHNTDRFLRSLGFALFSLTCLRTYSSAALPWPYLGDHPAETVNGRLLQGDALSLRDVCSPEMRHCADTLTDEKLAKATALFPLFGLHDQAAEVVLSFRQRLARLFDTERVLEMLAEAIQERSPRLKYSEYMSAFERDDPCFYGGGQPDSAEQQHRPLALLRQAENRIRPLAADDSTAQALDAPAWPLILGREAPHPAMGQRDRQDPGVKGSLRRAANPAARP